MEPNTPSQTTEPVPETKTPVIQSIQTTPSNSSSKTKYILLSVFILLIIFLVAGGIYYLGVVKQQSISQRNNNLIAVTSTPSPSLTPIPTIQPSPTTNLNPTANWKTYTNTDHNLEFKYPPNFSPINANDNKLIVAFIDKSNTKQRLSTSPDVSLRTFSIIPGEDYKNELIKDVVFAASGLHPKSFAEFSSKTMGNNTVYYIETGLFEGVLSLNYYLVDKNQVAAFAIVSSPVDWTNPSFKPENDPLNQSLFQILSTFRFIN